MAHFSLEELASGVYAAIGTDDAAGANAGIIDLGGSALLFDTFTLPQVTEQLQAAAEQLTGAQVRYVVNSHWHADHTLGNIAFPSHTAIISTPQTRTLIEDCLPARLKTLKQSKSDAERALRDLQEALEAAGSPGARAGLEQQIGFQQMLLQDMHRLVPRLPDWTFERQLSLHGEKRTAELLTFGGVHTASDVILYLPAERIVFVGDILFKGRHPWLGDGDLNAWPSVLEQLEALAPAVVVPGHGPVGTVEDFSRMSPYIEAVKALASDVIAAGGTMRDAEAIEIPEAFRDLDSPETFTANMRAAYEQLLNAD